MHRRERFGRFPSRCSSFTRRRGVEVQSLLGVLLPHVVPEMHVLITSPLFRAFDPSDLASVIALALCYPSPPSGWGRTFTSKLLSMPSTQRSRWRGGRCA